MMRKRVKYILLFILLTTVGNKAIYAQDVVLKAAADTNAIRIGEQFRLELEARYAAGVILQWPAVADTFHGFEVLNRSSVDTIRQQDGSFLRKQQLILTSFDTGFKVIPPFTALAVKGDKDTLNAESDPLLITVNTVMVDTTKAIRDIKDIERIPYTWQDALPWVFGFIGLVLIGWLVYYFIKKRRDSGAAIVPAEPQRPPHERALEELRRIDEAKLWQQGNFKAYHTRVTDVVRLYIQETRQVNILEMTTNEVLSLSIISSLSSDKYKLIKQLLELADLVKFAKFHPLPADNEQAMKMAVDFISAETPSNTPVQSTP